jgi:hypothetical protein
MDCIEQLQLNVDGFTISEKKIKKTKEQYY